jgi:hypothetical protein
MDLVCVEQLNLNLLINQQCFIVVIALCRKQAAWQSRQLVKDSEFRWIKGKTALLHGLSQRGTVQILMYAAQLCQQSRDVPYVWVPVGLIDERLEMECADFCTDDAMPWDETRSPSCHAGPVESLASLLKYLKLNS